MLMQDIWEKVKMENARSKAKYGLWRDLSDFTHCTAIENELEEFWKAVNKGDIHGEHGSVIEATHVINVLCRYIQQQTGEPDA